MFSALALASKLAFASSCPCLIPSLQSRLSINPVRIETTSSRMGQGKGTGTGKGKFEGGSKGQALNRYGRKGQTVPARRGQAVLLIVHLLDNYGPESRLFCK